jgi:hypothetical protein
MISASPVCTISPTLERVAGIRKVEHNGGHKIRTGPLDEALFHWVSWFSGARGLQDIMLDHHNCEISRDQSCEWVSSGIFVHQDY